MKEKLRKDCAIERDDMINTVNQNSTISPIRIAYIIEKFPSPTEFFILNEVLELERRNFELYILVLRKQKKYLNVPELKHLKSSIIYLPKFYFIFPFFSVFFSPYSFLRFSLSNIHFPVSGFLKFVRNLFICFFFASKLKSKNICHIHAHFAFLSVDIACQLAKLQGIKYSLTTHAQDIYTNEQKIKQVIDDARFTLTCTKYNRDYLNNITQFKYKDKIFTNYHGIDPLKWQLNNLQKELNNSEICILSIARLVEKKGLIYLVEAIHILIKKGYKVKCSIIGEGPLKETLENHIKDNRSHQYVYIIDFIEQTEVKKYFITSDLFILPCIIAQNGDRDGLPNVILEAMIMGVPVISTPVSAIPEIIEDRVTGILVRKNNANAIADAILELKNDRELYNKIVENSRRKLREEFTIESCTSKLIESFKNYI